MKTHTLLCKIDRRDSDFFLLDAATAHAFLEIARHANAPSHANANVALVRNALITIDGFLGELQLERDFRATIAVERDKLQKFLTALEQRSGESARTD